MLLIPRSQAPSAAREVLGNHGSDVTVTVVPGLEHDILLEPVAFDALTMLVETLVRDAQRQKVCGEIRRDPIDFRTLACRTSLPELRCPGSLR